MKGETQGKWEHSIPKTKNAQPRINITFRKVLIHKGTDNYYHYNVGEGIEEYGVVNGKMQLKN